MSGRTLVMDLGGVVLRWEPSALVAQALPDLAAEAGGIEPLAARLFQDFAPDGDWAQFDRGTVDAAGLAARMSQRTGLPLSRLRALVDAVPAQLTLLPGARQLLHRLRAAGLRVVYLSNMPLAYADGLEARAEFRTWFDGGVFSSRVGHVKPEPEIFAIAGERLGLDPARTLMVDDRAENLVEARRHGWSTVLFVDPERAVTELVALGWL